jgi:MoaA/NifB/PqqE/SkfB family radical SAM enzyme
MFKRNKGHHKDYQPCDKKGPSYATILVETRCSNSCLYCVNHNKDAAKHSKTSGIYINNNLSLTLEEFKNEVDILKENGVPKIHICGAGEPFFNKNMLDFIDYVFEEYNDVSFQTNFRRTFKNFIPEIARRTISYIGTDLVGGTKESFEKIKIGSKWEELWDNIAHLEDECRKNNNFIPLHMYCVINKQEITYKNAAALVKKCLEFKSIKNIVFHNIHAFGFNDFVDFKNIIKVSDYEIISLIENAKKLGKANGLEVSGPAYYSDSKNYNCRNFWSRIMLNFPNNKIPENKWKGNVMPGGCLAETIGELYSIGNVFDTDFWDIWNSEKMIQARKDSLKGNLPDKYCSICPAHYQQNH